MDESEKRQKQEDCHEDKLGQGILTLTNKRIVFEKTTGRIADFSKKFGDTLLDVQLGDIIKTWKEGILMKKACIRVKTEEGEKDYKFGVFSTGGWQKSIQKAMDAYKDQ